MSPTTAVLHVSMMLFNMSQILDLKNDTLGTAVAGQNTTYLPHKGVISPAESSLYVSYSDGAGPVSDMHRQTQSLLMILSLSSMMVLLVPSISTISPRVYGRISRQFLAVTYTLVSVVLQLISKSLVQSWLLPSTPGGPMVRSSAPQTVAQLGLLSGLGPVTRP